MVALVVDRKKKFKKAKKLLSPISTESFLAIDTEATGLSIVHGCRVFAVSACNHDGDCYYYETDVDPSNRRPEWSRRDLLSILKKIESYSTLVFFNFSFDYKALLFLFAEHEDLLRRFINHVNKSAIHDVAVLSHIYDSKGPKDLKGLSIIHLQMLDDDENKLDSRVRTLRDCAPVKKLGWMVARAGNRLFPGATKNFHKMDMWLPRAWAKHNKLPKTDPDWTICQQYAVKDAIRTAGLFYLFANHVNKHQSDLQAYELQQKVYIPITQTELCGLQLLPQKFREQIKVYQEEAQEINKSLAYSAELFGFENFNPDSGQQLQVMLYGENFFKFSPIKLTKEGISTDKTVLPVLAEQEGSTLQGRRFVKKLIRYRDLQSALRYLKSYDRFKLNYRLYPNLNQVGTSTTRLSSSEPNGQNVGKGKEHEEFDSDGNKIHKTEFSLRSVFGPSKENTFWLSTDYDQLQIRIFAYLSKEPTLISAIEQGFDFHETVAKILFETETVTKEQRKKAKYINFGLIFGAGPSKIDLLGGKRGTYTRFSKLFPNVIEVIAKTVEEVRKNGFIRTASGYPLTVPKNRAYAGVNYRVQGTEGDIVKRSYYKCNEILHPDLGEAVFNSVLNNVGRRVKRSGGEIAIQIHDEFIFEFQSYNKVPLRQLVQAMEDSGSYFGVPCKCKPELITTNWASPVKIPLDFFEKQNGFEVTAI